MKIRKETLKKWKSLKSRGDVRKIYDQSPELQEMQIDSLVARVSEAFKRGEASREVYLAMAKYYNRVEKQMKSVQ